MQYETQYIKRKVDIGSSCITSKPVNAAHDVART